MGYNTQKIDKVFESMTNKKHIHEGILLMENTEGDFSYSKTYSGQDVYKPFPIASITKLMTTTCMFVLLEEGKLSLDDKLAKYIPDNTLHHLHLYKGKDYSGHLTLAHLLFQTSGLPDISLEGTSILKKVVHHDMQIDFDDIIKMTKQLKPHFAPNIKKKAYYADVNFDLLGKVIETVTQSTLHDVYKQFIFNPLKLDQTYLPETEDDVIPHVYYKDTALYRPQFIRSCRASGGVLSNAHELMVFIKAFFNGELFSQAIFNDLKGMNKLQVSMFPIRYGAGYMAIPLTGFANLFMGKGTVMGHSGSTGSFAFYYPIQDLFFVGNLNQMSSPAFPVRLTMQLAMNMTSQKH